MLCSYRIVINIFVISIIIDFLKADITDNTIEQCQLPPSLIKEIARYEKEVTKIKNCVLYGPCKGTTYNHLADFIDTFGNRIAGSQNLENSIDYMLNKSVCYGLENVHGEQANVVHWVR